jgi:hypothetical protein
LFERPTSQRSKAVTTSDQWLAGEAIKTMFSLGPVPEDYDRFRRTQGERTRAFVRLFPIPFYSGHIIERR